MRIEKQPTDSFPSIFNVKLRIAPESLEGSEDPLSGSDYQEGRSGSIHDMNTATKRAVGGVVSDPETIKDRDAKTVSHIDALEEDDEDSYALDYRHRSPSPSRNVFPRTLQEAAKLQQQSLREARDYQVWELKEGGKLLILRAGMNLADELPRHPDVTHLYVEDEACTGPILRLMQSPQGQAMLRKRRIRFTCKDNPLMEYLESELKKHSSRVDRYGMDQLGEYRIVDERVRLAKVKGDVSSGTPKQKEPGVLRRWANRLLGRSRAA